MKAHESLLAAAEAVIREIAGHEGLELVDVECRREPGGCVVAGAYRQAAGRRDH